MARRRKNYGSPPSEHRTRAGLALAAARRFAKLTRDDARHGPCGAAISALAKAAWWAGQAKAESTGAGRSRQLSSTVISLARRVQSACIVGRR